MRGLLGPRGLQYYDGMVHYSYMRTYILAKPTAVKEDYLRAIFLLQEKSAHEIKLIDVAEYLGLSRSTVSERVQELVEQGYITHSKYAHISFTRLGYATAKKLTHKHRVIEVFLHEVLHLSTKASHAEAHRLEHALSDKVIKKLGVFLGNPAVDPHGTRIPKL